MRGMVMAASFIALGAAPAIAADIMAGYYGNTVVVTGAALSVHVHYRADHTFDVAGTRSGTAVSTRGSWKIDDKGLICRTYETPPPGSPNPFCFPIQAHKVGDTWSVKDPAGGMNKNTLVAGVQ
jgi:hypothetical protein